MSLAQKDLRRAAQLLKQWSDALRDSIKSGGVESCPATVIEVDEMAELSKKLYAAAREKKSGVLERPAGEPS